LGTEVESAFCMWIDESESVVSTVK